MPHVVVKMIEGRTEEQKRRVAEMATAALLEAIGCEEGSVSVAIEDIPAERWDAEVFEPDIRARKHTLYKRPGYASLD